MTRALATPTSTATPSAPRRRRLLLGLAPVLTVALTLGACGGDDDPASESSAPSSSTASLPVTSPSLPSTPVTPAPAPITQPATPPPASYVTQGASVMVVNASRVDGSAGRLTDRLANVGYVTVEPNNYAPGELETTIIYVDPANPTARPVADSLVGALGGGGIQVLDMPSPLPIESGDLLGAGVLVAMGNDIADKSLEELQGLVAPSTTAAPTSETTGATGDDTGTATDDSTTTTTGA